MPWPVMESVFEILHLILDCKFLDLILQALKRQLPSSNVLLARVIKKCTIMSHPSHTGLLSYTSTYLQRVVAIGCT